MTTYAATARAFRSLEACLPVDPLLVACTHCGEPVDGVDGRGRCDDCGSDRLLALLDEVSTADLAVAATIGHLSFARRETAAREAELAADEGFTAWLADRRDAANELRASEVDARANALRARAVAAEVATWGAHDAGNDDAVTHHGHRAERLWAAREAAVVIARTLRGREVA